MNSKHYKILDYIRVLSCILVFLYHLGIISGGFLAVSSFFVLSGYLNTLSGFKEDKFSLKKYYISRIKKVYIPLFVVVFISIIAVSTFTNFNWINLKPETTSVIGGFNNIWQINANLDYFVRNASSPFIHFWYIAILLQFELVFPFIFIFLKFLGKKIGKFIPCFLLFGVSILSFMYFAFEINSGNIMSAYYGSFTRLFSLSLGVFLGFFHNYYGVHILKKLNKVIVPFYLLCITLLSVFISNESSFLIVSMFLVTIITMRLISYALNCKNINSFDKLINKISKYTYEIYLIQYPVIFIFQYINMNSILKILLIIIITIILSFIINLSLNIKREYKTKIIRIILLIFVILLSMFGLYKYIVSKDYSGDIEKLKNDLDNNRKLIEEKENTLLAKEKEEETKWEEFIKNENNEEAELKNLVKNMRIVGIGDSVMELAVPALYDEFPNGYFDGLTNRTDHEAASILRNLDAKGLLGEVIVFNLGTNGECSPACKEEIMKVIGNRKLFWVNATRPDFASFNPNLIEFAKKHDNVYIIDWISVAKEHPEYLIYDGIHPTTFGCKMYAKTIYDAIYNHFLNELQKEKEAKIKEHEEYEKNKITFIGNDLLSGIYDELDKEYTNKKLIIDYDFTYEKLLDIVSNENLSNNIVLIFDNSIDLDTIKINNIIDKLGDRKVYIINNDKYEVKDNVININFNIDKYIMFDKIHITEEGKQELFNLIKKNIINN